MSKKPISNRNRYNQEYDELIIRRKTLAFKAVGFLQALVKMDERTFGEATRLRMISIVQEYNKVDEEIDHLSALLDLIDYDDGTDSGEWQ